MSGPRLLVEVRDLDDAIEHYRSTGHRIDRISPADDPLEVDMSGHGRLLRISRSVDAVAGPYPDPVTDELDPVEEHVHVLDVPDADHELVISRVADSTGFGSGRAGMGYRDLIPSRLGGRFIASHIRIDAGGDVPDYAHYHRIRFQMIFCRAGWVRVVYEDQGEPFVLNAGDCVLQPPEIRHRVLESSAGLEVVEIGCPATHDTYADHDITLPTGTVDPERDFGGQRFVRHVAADAPWHRAGDAVRYQDLGIGAATTSLAGAYVLEITDACDIDVSHRGEFRMLYLLDGDVRLECLGDHELVADDSVVVPPDTPATITADPGARLLEVTLPALRP